MMAEEDHKPIGPARFLRLAKYLLRKNEVDIEAWHGDADTLMERELRALGYGEAIDLIQQSDRWYK